MPTGSMTLLEASKYGTNMLKKGVVETLIQESPILPQLPFITIAGNALESSTELNLPSPEFRKVNETYGRSWGTDTKHFWGVTILGGEVFVDNFLLNVTSNKESIKARQYRKFAKAMSRTFDKSFFDGTGTADDFKGLNALLSEGWGFTVYAEDGAANGGTLALNDLDIAKDKLRAQSSPDAWLCNRFVRRHITYLAHTTHSGFSLIDVGTDRFGTKVNFYDGVPLRIVGDDIDGNAILGFDETRGTSNQTASMYAVAYGTDENVCGLLGAGGHFDVRDFGETEAAPGHLGRVEVYPGIAVFNQYSLVRVAGILEQHTGS